MLVSWNWLKDYVDLNMSQAELETRLAMSGLNHEGTENVGDDLSIDLEVTSNRPDCLGHIGVAREVAVLWNSNLKIATPEPISTGSPVESAVQVRIDCPELCQRYTARIIRNLKIGPSPDWLVKRLQTVFRKQRKDGQVDEYQPINNVVDITNYVLMECGQPLHAFDWGRTNGGEIILRKAAAGETFAAIDHRTYQLDAGMCVVADAKAPLALAGVMGGSDSEVNADTTEVLIEAAEFAPLSVRTTARKLKLHSPSSYRFERGVDPLAIDWASRRCCEMILDLAGGELAAGVVDVGQGIPSRTPLVLRLSQLKRILGIELDASEVQRILTALGCVEEKTTKQQIETIPPSWRRDLTREIDLVEEIARVHGYDKIPEDVGVPMAPSHRTDTDRVLAKVRMVLTSTGFDESMTASVVPQSWSSRFSPWTKNDPIQSTTPMLKGADRLRRSLVPSLLEVRRVNESLANPVVELFETAKVYLPTEDKLPTEPLLVALASGGDFFHVKGVIETILRILNPEVQIRVKPLKSSLLEPDKSSELFVGDRRLGFLGEVSEKGTKEAGLRTACTIAEIDFGTLAAIARLIPQHHNQSNFPAMSRDINLIVDESIQWEELASTVEQSAGPLLETLAYEDIYRDTKKDGNNKKRFLFSITLRSSERTLTHEEADQVREVVVTACQKKLGGQLLV